jgi:hypothetical protein
MAIKSLVIRALIDVAGKSHNCQANSKHRVKMGDLRLKVRNGRSWDHYCCDCARKMLELDIEKLKELQTLKPSI